MGDGRRGQTLIEYREASKRYGDEGGIVSADDRILHCCLDFSERLGCTRVGKVEEGGRAGEFGAGNEGVALAGAGLGSPEVCSGKMADGRQPRLILLTNDIMLRNKVC
jgi:hypothetical protein